MERVLSRNFSDQATNFLLAERELRGGVRDWNQLRLHESLRQKNVKWHFNPALSPAIGGAWEILVKTVKKILHSLAGERYLDDEALHSLLVEVEGFMNNWPPTPVSDHPQDLPVLTPASILTGALDSSLPAGVFPEADGYRRSWRRWIKEYLPLLQHRQKWLLQPSWNLHVGGVVLMCETNRARGVWLKALVTETLPDKDGVVRSVRARTANSSVLRDVRKFLPAGGIRLKLREV